MASAGRAKQFKKIHSPRLPSGLTDCGVCQCVPGDVCQRCPNVIALSMPAENGTDFDMSSEPTANNSEPQENGQPPHYPSEADALSCSFMLLFFPDFFALHDNNKRVIHCRCRSGFGLSMVLQSL